MTKITRKEIADMMRDNMHKSIVEELTTLRNAYMRNAREIENFMSMATGAIDEGDAATLKSVCTSAIHYVSVNSTQNLRLDVLACRMVDLAELNNQEK